MASAFPRKLEEIQIYLLPPPIKLSCVQTDMAALSISYVNVQNLHLAICQHEDEKGNLVAAASCDALTVKYQAYGVHLKIQGSHLKV